MGGVNSIVEVIDGAVLLTDGIHGAKERFICDMMTSGRFGMKMLRMIHIWHITTGLLPR